MFLEDRVAFAHLWSGTRRKCDRLFAAKDDFLEKEDMIFPVNV